MARAHHSSSDIWCRVAHSSLHHLPERAPLRIKGDVSPMGSASVLFPPLGLSSAFSPASCRRLESQHPNVGIVGLTGLSTVVLRATVTTKISWKINVLCPVSSALCPRCLGRAVDAKRDGLSVKGIEE